MDKSIPKGAAILLDFLAKFESGGSYNIVFGNHDVDLHKPISLMTLNELLVIQKQLAKKWGSSAAGRYQIMQNTLSGLIQTMKLTGNELFDANMQDRLAYQLLKQRGYAAFKAGTLSTAAFGKKLAQEWASLPVLEATQGAHRKVARSETYYAGDKLNRALVSPMQVETVLGQVKTAAT